MKNYENASLVGNRVANVGCQPSMDRLPVEQSSQAEPTKQATQLRCATAKPQAINAIIAAAVAAIAVATAGGAFTA